MHPIIAVATCLVIYLVALGATLGAIMVLRIFISSNAATDLWSPELRAAKAGLLLLVGGIAGSALLEQLPLQGVVALPWEVVIMLLGAWTGWQWWKIILHGTVRA
jgi:hypothetical protein